MGHRRKAREYALQGLYTWEMRILETGIDREQLRGEILSFDWIDREITEDIRNFATSLVEGVLANIDEIDATITGHSKNWKLERLTIVDKSILRLSIFEMNYLPEIPVTVSINEGIELGKIYGGEGSGQFINGILDAVKTASTERGKNRK